MHSIIWGQHVDPGLVSHTKVFRLLNNVEKRKFWEADDFVSFLGISDMGLVSWNKKKMLHIIGKVFVQMWIKINNPQVCFCK